MVTLLLFVLALSLIAYLIQVAPFMDARLKSLACWLLAVMAVVGVLKHLGMLGRFFP